MEYLKKIAAIEPARLRAVLAAVVGLLAALGISVTAETSGAVEALLIGALTLLPLILGESIRSKVSPAVETPEAIAGVEEL